MNTMYQRRTQLSVFAVAALAIFAVAAVMLLAGGGPAQADTTSLAPDDGTTQQRPQQADPTPTPPRHAPPPACSKDAAAVVDSGHIALFDVWWNPEELELTNTSCPPTVTHVPAQAPVPPSRGNPGKPGTPARDDRTPSNIDIDKTIIHIPNTAKVNLNETDYPKEEYEALWKADALEDRSGATRGDDEKAAGDGMVWVLPACPPEGTPPSNGLCIAFSAALLRSADWKDGRRIVYHLDHVHQVDIDKQDPRYTLAYDKDGKLLWNSSDVKVVEMKVTPGEYERPVLFFTSRGTYEFQVHITGEPNHATNRDDGLKPVSLDNSVSSDMRTYIIHVGAEADLGVTATASPDNPSPGDEVTVTIAASNAGPETAPNASVDVTLPSELTYSSHTPTGATFADSDGDGVWTWKVGSLAPKASQTLTIKATVAAETHGRKLAVKAAVSGTEPVKITEREDSTRVVKNYDLPVADKEPGNNADTAVVTVASEANADPMFMVMRSVTENSPAETLVGDPIMVWEPNSGDKLTFSLTGMDADKFTVSSVSGSAQIKVAAGANLDYETKSKYELELGVSDGKNAQGNADPSVDQTIRLMIQLIDEPYKATLSVNKTSANVGENVTFTVAIQDPPVNPSQMNWEFVTEDESDAAFGTFQPYSYSESTAGTYTFYAHFWQWDDSFTEKRYSIDTNRVTVTWSNP